MSQYDPIPPHMMAAMKHYVATGQVSSDFLIAVIDNDLKKAVSHADDHNREILYLYVMWFYNRAPTVCWGSRENRLNWTGVGGTMTTVALRALAAYRARGSVSLKDRDLEAALFARFRELEQTIDQIGPTSLRHKLSELLVQMRAEIWAFDQYKE